MFFCVSGPARAANLGVYPIRLTLDSSRSIGSLHLTNRGDQPVVMQAAVRAWTIADNEEQYADTDALIVTPPVFTIAPGQSQVVRVGLRQPVASTTEQAFRVFLEQAPATPADPAQPGQAPNSLQVMLRLGIPVFITPEGEVTRAVEWHAERVDNDKLRIEAVNNGNVHVRVQRLELMGAEGALLAEKEELTYLLPGSRRHWLLDLPPGVISPYRIKAWTESGEQEVEITAGGS